MGGRTHAEAIAMVKSAVAVSQWSGNSTVPLGFVVRLVPKHSLTIEAWSDRPVFAATGGQPNVVDWESRTKCHVGRGQIGVEKGAAGHPETSRHVIFQ